VQGAAQADVQDPVVIGVGDVQKLDRLGNPSVVDQHIDATQLGLDLGHGGLA
jgi:hypothetical protein